MKTKTWWKVTIAYDFIPHGDSHHYWYLRLPLSLIWASQGFFTCSTVYYLSNKVSINLMLWSRRTVQKKQNGKFWLKFLLYPHSLSWTRSVFPAFETTFANCLLLYEGNGIPTWRWCRLCRLPVKSSNHPGYEVMVKRIELAAAPAEAAEAEVEAARQR